MPLIVFLLLVCISLNSCGTSATEPVAQSNYPGNINTIIQANCLGGDCHSRSTSTNASLDLSTWENMTKGSIYFNDVIPFSAVKSHLFGHVNTNSNLGPVLTPTMPLARDHLSSSDQMAFFNWINQGAKSADGKIAYSEATKKIFAVNQNEDMVSIIDADTKRLIRIISVGSKYTPSAIAMMPDLKTLIVAMSGANGTIRKYDIESYAAISEFKSNLVPSEIAITPDGSKGYMTDDSYSGNRFGVFDPVAMTMSKTISSPLLIEPRSVTISPDGKYAYICGHGSDNIVRVDTRNDSVMGCLTLGPDVPVPVPATGYSRKYLPQEIVISADSRTMYVTSENTSEVVVFDLIRDSIIARIPTPILPWGIALTPDGSELWTADWGNSKVHVISTLTNQVIAVIDSVSQDPHAITITPDGAYAYVACEFSAGGAHNHGTGAQPPSSFVVIDCKTRKKLTTQDLPGLSVGIVAGYK